MTSNIFRSKMAKHGISIEHIAQELGLTPATIARKVSGRTDFTLTEVRKVLAMFRGAGNDYTVEELFGLAL